jgi:hypothetical protein
MKDNNEKRRKPDTSLRVTQMGKGRNKSDNEAEKDKLMRETKRETENQK